MTIPMTGQPVFRSNIKSSSREKAERRRVREDLPLRARDHVAWRDWLALSLWRAGAYFRDALPARPFTLLMCLFGVKSRA
jgi:hypothetical protein